MGRVISIACENVVIVQHAFNVWVDLSSQQEPIDQSLVAQDVHHGMIVVGLVDDIPLGNLVAKVPMASWKRASMVCRK